MGKLEIEIGLFKADNFMLIGFVALLFDGRQICLTSVFRKILIVDGEALDEIYKKN